MMKGDMESKMDNLVQNIGELATDVQRLAREAVQQYAVEVEAILRAQSRDSKRIEKCLDAMLDFCFDDCMLVLYKKLCRYYFVIDQTATTSYVHAYREMWDEQETVKRGKLPSTKKGRHASGKRGNRIKDRETAHK
jgi:outer membrane murein-binding lipoprotein Lpp